MQPAIGTDALGDDTETWTMVASDVPAHLAERTRRVFDQNTGRYETVRFVRLITPAGTTLGKGWRITDQADSAVYTITETDSIPNRSPISHELATADMTRVV